MGKKRLSKDQQRKKKLAERSRRRGKTQADHDDYFESDEFLPYVHATESGVGQADVLSGRRLTDGHVRAGMLALIETMSGGPLPLLGPGLEIAYEPGQEAELVARMIRVGWEDCFATHAHPGQDVLTGILRRLLGSIETFTTRSRSSRGYLSFLDGFLSRAGMSFALVGPDGEEVEEDRPDDPLMEAGLAWVEDGDWTARREFYLIANEMIAAGQHEHVAQVAQSLAGAVPPQDVLVELGMLSLSAQSRQKFLPPVR